MCPKAAVTHHGAAMWCIDSREAVRASQKLPWQSAASRDWMGLHRYACGCAVLFIDQTPSLKFEGL